MASWTLNVLGGWALTGRSGSVAIVGRKHAALLAYLACGQTRKHRREKLAALLWGDRSESNARQSLRQALANLRRVLGDEAIAAQGDMVSLSGETVSCDAARFEELVADDSAAALGSAIVLYKGPLLADFALESEGWQDWLTAERQRLETLALDGLVRHGTSLLEEGRGGEALALAQRATAIDPFREDAHRLAIRAAVADGRRPEGLRLYQQFSDILRRELDLEPDAETRRLVEEISAPDVRVVPADRVVREALTAFEAPTTLAVAPKPTGGPGRPRDHAEIVARLGEGVVVDRSGGTLFIEFSDARTAVKAARQTIGPDLGIGLHAYGERERARSVAAAAAAAAPPGEVIATSDVCDRIVDDWDARVEDLGEARLTSAGAPSRVYRLGKAEGATSGRRHSVSLLPAIAVLPFECRGSSPQNRAVGDFLADEIIAAMALCQEMAVLSRLSTRVFRDGLFTLSDVAERLHADYALWGSCEVGRERVVIRAELTDVASQEVIWQDRFEPPAISLTLESGALVERLLHRIQASIFKREFTRSQTQSLVTLENYSLLAAAVSLIHGTSPQSLERASQLLAHLVGRLDHHALPSAWLAILHMFRVALGMSADPAAEAQRAVDLAQRATDLDPSCAIAHATEAWVQLHLLKRFDVAADHLDLALQCNRNEPTSWLLKGAMHAFRGEGTEAVAATERALRLSPLDPRRSYYDCLAAAAYLSAGRPRDAIEVAERSLRVNRQHSSTLRALAVARVQAGDLTGARSLIPDLMRLEPGLTVSGYLRRHPASDFPIGRQWAQALRAAGVPE